MNRHSIKTSSSQSVNSLLLRHHIIQLCLIFHNNAPLQWTSSDSPHQSACIAIIAIAQPVIVAGTVLRTLVEPGEEWLALVHEPG